MDRDQETRDQIIDCLSAPCRRLPSSFHYDTEGSRLFEIILQQPEYHVPRVERALISNYAQEMLAAIPGFGVGRAALIELGASDGQKANFLLDAAGRTFATYVAINIDQSVLATVRCDVRRTQSHLRVETIAGDFTQNLTLPPMPDISLPIGLFPGGTIGQFDRVTLVRLFERMREALRPWPAAAFIVGCDVCREPARLLRAYDDAAGANAAFNLNLLAHLNRLGNGTFDVAGFRHLVRWNEAESRIEFYLKSLCDQTARFAGHLFRFAAGEEVGTGVSYKRSRQDFETIAADGGWTSKIFWTDAHHLFELHLLVVNDPA